MFPDDDEQTNWVPGQYASDRKFVMQNQPPNGEEAVENPAVGREMQELAIANESTSSKPTIEELVKSVRKQRDLGSLQGRKVFTNDDWVEILGIDMRWHLARLDHVQEIAMKRWDFNPDTDVPEIRSYYFIKGRSRSFGSLLHNDDVRAPTEGLQAVFGMRPWLWQQYALIRLEALLRFEKYHAADFEAVNIYETVKSWFKSWLNDPQNGDFMEKYRNEEESTQFLLKQNLFTPFKLIERIRDDSETWDFSEESITVYSYLAILGDGILTPVLTMIIQVALPILLFLNTVLNGTEDDGQPAKLVDFPENLCDNSIFDTALDGTNLNIYIKKVVLSLIILIYVLKVIPDTFYAFYNVAGVSGTTYSKMNSLREKIFRDRKDEVSQWVGFKLDRFMNTAYLNILYLVMLFILFLTENTLDIILNALAISFIHEIDENLANAPWWDRDFRWIKSGTMQLVMQDTIDVDSLGNKNKLCAKYGINPTAYEKLFTKKQKVKSFKDKTQADLDEMNEEYEEGMNTPTKLRDSEEQIIHFGSAERFLGLLGLDQQGQFNHYLGYRVWSRWNKVMFLPEIPPAAAKNSEAWQKTSKTTMSDHKDWTRFVKGIMLDVLTTKALWKGVYEAMTTGKWVLRPFKMAARFFEGLADLASYALPLLFPFAVVASLVSYFVCR